MAASRSRKHTFCQGECRGRVRAPATVRHADGQTERVGRGVDQQVSVVTSLPWLPQISPITSQSQASLAAGRPAGAAGPAHELLSAAAQMALRQDSPDTSADEEGGQGATFLEEYDVCVCVLAGTVEKKV